MRDADFTHDAYRALMGALKSAGYGFSLFREPAPTGKTVTLRHDVDRLPMRAQALGELEASMDVKATYFVRTKPHVFKPAIIQALAERGHEIGYHYEDLVDSQGDAARAWDYFRRNLDRLRSIVPVSSIAMHGRPFSKIDGRDLWRDFDYRSLGVSCEAYLDIDWSSVHYFSDTGRGWNSTANVRDRPLSDRRLNSPRLRSTRELGQFLATGGAPAIISTHPERWTASLAGWLQVHATDGMTNAAKRIFTLLPKTHA